MRRDFIMRNLLIILSLIILGFQTSLNAQTVEWSKTWGDGENQESFAGVALSTGGFVTSVSGQTDAILVKYDSSGEIIWTSVVGGSAELYSLHSTQDDGFIISGLTGTQYVAKTNSLGSIEWSKELSLGTQGRARDAIQTPDGGYMVTGDTVGDNSSSAFILKLDGNGQQQWVEYFDLSNRDIGNSIVQTSDNEYIIAGSTRMRSGHGLDALLIKIDNEGNTLWQKVFGKTGNEEIYDMLQLANGDLILVGYSDSYMNKGEDIWLVKANALGDSVWSKNYGGASDDRGRSITQTNDGGFAFAGSYWGNQGEDFIIVRTDIQGEQLWSKLMGGSKGEQARSIAKTIDFGFILTGVTSSFGNGGGDVWTVKIGFSPIPIISSETILIDIDHDGFAETILNGSESYHPEGASIVSYSWLLNNSEIGNESQISVTLPTGTNQVVLTITDENGSSNSTTIDITVVPGDLPTPVIITDNKWIDTDENGYAAGTLDGTSSNHSAGYAIVDYKWKYGGYHNRYSKHN